MIAPPEGTSYIGQRVKRKEDRRLLTGRGRYIDDMEFPGALHAAFLRSPYPHARLKRVDVTQALKLPGVTSILTGSEVVALCDSMIGGREEQEFRLKDYPLAVGKVRYVGEPIAVVAATNRYMAEDAVEGI